MSWRDLPQDIPAAATTPLARQRQMRGFFKIYAIVFGLAFATVLTLVVIPSLLMLVTPGDGPKRKWFGWLRRGRA